MRRRRLKRLWKRLHELQGQKLSRDQLLLKLGAAKKDAGQAYRLVDIDLPAKDQSVNRHTFTFSVNKEKLRQVRRREGHYLLRSNLSAQDPGKLWEYYIQLTEIEQAFKELKSDLAIRPIYHQLDERIEAHIFVAFLAYCLQVTLKQRLRALAPGLTPRAVLEKFAAMQMVDVHLPHHRRTATGAFSLHRARQRPAAPAPANEATTPGPVTTKDHLNDPTPVRLTNLLQCRPFDFNNGKSTGYGISSAESVKSG